jgi:hypothetical protein
MPITFLRSLSWSVAIALFAATSSIFYLSLNHPITADLAMLHYSAWLINEKHFVLYRDIFDINFPAPYLFHSLLGKAIGYNALPLRWVDFCLMAALGFASWKIVSPLSKSAAIFGFSLFCVLYWFGGGEYVLERDVLALVPAALAFTCAISANKKLTHVFMTGMFAAIACSMKPNSVVILPVLLWMLTTKSRTHTDKHNALSTHTPTTVIALFLLTMLLVSAIPFVWVAQAGGLQDFFTIYHNFMPIYANSRFDLWHYDNSAERWLVLAKNTLHYGGLSLLLSVPGLAWGWLCHRDNNMARLRIKQLAAMTFAFIFYEVLAGKFWFNHMFPSAYWSFLCFALLLTIPNSNTATWQKYCSPILIFPCAWLAWTLASLSYQQMQQAHDREITAPNTWRAREISNYLSTQQLSPDDTVQVLDMAGDGQAILLRAQAASATRFLIDVPLYMEPKSIPTQTIRAQFVQELQRKNPKYIVYIEQFLHVGGGNRLKEFKPLFNFVSENYSIAQQREGAYIIYHRKD